MIIKPTKWLVYRYLQELIESFQIMLKGSGSSKKEEKETTTNGNVEGKPIIKTIQHAIGSAMVPILRLFDFLWQKKPAQRIKHHKEDLEPGLREKERKKKQEKEERQIKETRRQKKEVTNRIEQLVREHRAEQREKEERQINETKRQKKEVTKRLELLMKEVREKEESNRKETKGQKKRATIPIKKEKAAERFVREQEERVRVRESRHRRCQSERNVNKKSSERH